MANEIGFSFPHKKLCDFGSNSTKHLTFHINQVPLSCNICCCCLFHVYAFLLGLPLFAGFLFSSGVSFAATIFALSFVAAFSFVAGLFFVATSAFTTGVICSVHSRITISALSPARSPK